MLGGKLGGMLGGNNTGPVSGYRSRSDIIGGGAICSVIDPGSVTVITGSLATGCGSMVCTFICVSAAVIIEL